MGVLWKIYPCNMEEVFGKQKQKCLFLKNFGRLKETFVFGWGIY